MWPKKHPPNCNHCKSLRGKIPWNKGLTKEISPIVKKYSETLTGRKLSEEHRLKSAIGSRKTQFKTGKNHPAWAGGVTGEIEKARKSLEYKLWRKAVFARDKWTCVSCGFKSCKKNSGQSDIEADHIKPFAFFPELRFAIDNGATLCVSCHRKTPTYGMGAKKVYEKIISAAV